ncbi:MAG: repeat-containing protein, partial [Cyanobacteria bacterium RYN_339]|nr:repeat-containing protein [Cyanobacteria bacterium RYN_339]
VTAPAAVISNNGASLVGVPIISDQGGGLVSVVRVPIISDHGGSYDVLGLPAGAEGPLRDAFLVLADRDERFFRDKLSGEVFHATSDAQGRFLFPLTAGNGFPVGKDVVVTARLAGDLRLSGYLAPVAGENRLRVDLATTLATEYLRGAAVRQGKALGAYDTEGFYDAAVQTEGAIATGAIEAVNAAKQLKFDLRADQAEGLRNQYAVAISAVEAGATSLHALSDAWKRLLGERPIALTTVLDDASAPAATGPAPTGGVLGRAAAHAYTDIATTPDGDQVVLDQASATPLTWLKPDGTRTAIELPARAQVGGTGLALEPGAVLVASGAFNRVQRVPLAAKVEAVELLAGATTSFAGQAIPPTDPADPYVVDGPTAYALVVDRTTPATSSWRLAEEGARTYASGKPVPNAARFAHLFLPLDVATDELGNIYISDAGNQRIRMIPKEDGTYFGYRQPLGKDGVVTGFGEPTGLKAGCIYTIAGNPRWDPAKAVSIQTSPWFGEFGGDNGPAQAARFDQPAGLAFFAGALYVADTENQRVRRIDRATGVVTTVAGNPGGAQAPVGIDFAYPQGWAGDGGPAAQAHLANPAGLAVDATRKLLYVSDRGSGRVRAIDLADPRQVITTVAGRGRDPAVSTIGALHLSDGDALRWADLSPDGLAVDALGNLLIASAAQGRVCKAWRQWE